MCDACHACRDKEVARSTGAARERQLRELCDRYRKTDGSYDCLGAGGTGGKDSFYAAHLLKYKYGMHPLDRHLGTAHVHALGLEELSGVDSRRV